MELKLETITPLFIGSGFRFSGMDYFFYENKIYFLNLDKVIHLLGEGNTVRQKAKWLRDFIRYNFKNNRVDNKDELFTKSVIQEIISKRLYEREVIVDDPEYFKTHYTKILEFIRTKGKPYIPGSSIKGALRTAIMYDALEIEDVWDGKPAKNLKKDIDKRINQRFNQRVREKYSEIIDFSNEDDETPSNRLFRKIIISDVNLTGEVVIRTAIRKTKRGEMPINLETFFGKGKFTIKSPIKWETLKKICNDYSYVALEYFKANAEKRKDQKTVNKIDEYLNMVNQEDALYIFLGGHNGWLFKTLHDHILSTDDKPLNQNLRKLLGLGKIKGRFTNVFPGTYFLTKHGGQILGFVKINNESD